ncbi:MAG: efflux RND transporter permease subunit [Phycisphaeraceae bacterium]|nr:efflux RND transporter permease subunit [Phycisphaeraceae bacterium]
MNPIRFALENPVKVSVGVILIVLFGFLALFTIPVQLSPNVDQPLIRVTTIWVGASPQDIERNILRPQEDKLKGISGLRKMTSTADLGRAEISLEFAVGINKSAAFQEVSDKLREVPSYPEGVESPVIVSADTEPDQSIAWMLLTCDDESIDIGYFFDSADRLLKPFLERVDDLAEVRIFGGRSREIHIEVDPTRMAQRELSYAEVIEALRAQNLTVSAGEIPLGRVQTTIRGVGEFTDVEQINRTIIRQTDRGTIRVEDIGRATLNLEKERAFVRSKGRAALAIPAFRESGSNVMQVMQGLRGQIEAARAEILPQMSRQVQAELGLSEPPQLRLEQLYDETIYISSAISLVQNNLYLGGSLAILTLLIFLRAVRPTMVVALAIPISIIGTFLVMTAAGRNLNVISLAGMAFAVGMVVDAAIVVLENIDRHINMGKSPIRAAYDGAGEVWGAILASALTTLAVFVPVLAMQEEAGQLFRDIALAICAAVSLSLVVSVTVIPTASSRFLRANHVPRLRILRAAQNLFGLATIMAGVVGRYAKLIHWLCAPDVPRVFMRICIVLLFTISAIALSMWMMPSTSYLPEGNRNLIFGLLFTPPGYTVEKQRTLAKRMERELTPYWNAQRRDDLVGLPPVMARDFATGQMRQVENIPPIDNFFYVTFGSLVFYGASSQEEEVVRPLMPLLSQAGGVSPGVFSFAFQPSIFGRTAGTGNTIDVEISITGSDDDFDQLRETASMIFGVLVGSYGPGSIRPTPGNFNLTAMERRFKARDARAKELGVDQRLVNVTVQALNDGAFAGEFRTGNETIDILVKRNPDIPVSPEALLQTPIAAADQGVSRIIPLRSVVEYVDAPSPQQIQRIEQFRTVTLSVTVPEQIALEDAERAIASQIQGLRDQGMIPPDVRVNITGTAAKLSEVRNAMLGQWTGFNVQSVFSLLSSRIFLALIITFLLMAALFESFLYPLVIMFTVPLATVGGFIGLAVVQAYHPTQQLDVLTMLGFIILIGIVVNSAILIVHQSLNFMRGRGSTSADSDRALKPREAIAESVRTRVRPVFMTTITSVCGMLPLVAMPGAGSELYRGLGSVVVGGLLVSSLFTLIVVPLLFSLVMDAKIKVYSIFNWQVKELDPNLGRLRLDDEPAPSGASIRDWLPLPGAVPVPAVVGPQAAPPVSSDSRFVGGTDAGTQPTGWRKLLKVWLSGGPRKGKPPGDAQ